MVTATIVFALTTGLFAGYAARQAKDIQTKNMELSAYQEGEVRNATLVADLRTQVKAHETTLEMVMREVVE